MIKITTVLIAIAKSESTFLIPILAKMAVIAAKNADNKAYIHHMSNNYDGVARAIMNFELKISQFDVDYFDIGNQFLGY